MFNSLIQGIRSKRWDFFLVLFFGFSLGGFPTFLTLYTSNTLPAQYFILIIVCKPAFMSVLSVGIHFGQSAYLSVCYWRSLALLSLVI